MVLWQFIKKKRRQQQHEKNAGYLSVYTDVLFTSFTMVSLIFMIALQLFQFHVEFAVGMNGQTSIQILALKINSTEPTTINPQPNKKGFNQASTISGCSCVWIINHEPTILIRMPTIERNICFIIFKNRGQLTKKNRNSRIRMAMYKSFFIH